MDVKVKNSCFAKHTNKLRKRQARGGDQDGGARGQRAQWTSGLLSTERKSKSLKNEWNRNQQFTRQKIKTLVIKMLTELGKSLSKQWTF